MTVLSAHICYASHTIMEAHAHFPVRTATALEFESRYNAYLAKFLPHNTSDHVKEVWDLIANTSTYTEPAPVTHKRLAGVLVHVRDGDGREYMQRVDAG